MYWLMTVLSVAVIDNLFSAAQTKPQKCPLGEHWVSAHHRRAHFKSDGTFVSASDVSAHCRKNPGGYQVWNPKLFDGMPPYWRLRQEKPGRWTTEERERVLESLGETPLLLRNEKIGGIYRMKGSIFPGNPASNNYADIVLYDEAFGSKEGLTHVLNHELAHRLYQDMSDSERADFAKAAGWKLDPDAKSLKPTRPLHEFIRENGRLNVVEDFADCIATYVHQPRKLQRTAQKIFTWIRQTFGNRLVKDGTK